MKFQTGSTTNETLNVSMDMSGIAGFVNQIGDLSSADSAQAAMKALGGSAAVEADAAAGVDEIFQFDIDDEYWHTVIADDACQIVEGEHDDPSVTLSMDAETLQEVMSGETDGMQAFMAGRIKATGNMMLATQLTSLFPVA